MDVAADAMLGREESHKFHAFGIVEDVDGAFEIIIYAGRVGDKSHTFAFEAFEATVAQHLHARFDMSRSRNSET